MNACRRLAAVVAACALAGCAVMGHDRMHDLSGTDSFDCKAAQCSVSVGVKLDDGLCVLVVDRRWLNVLGTPGETGRPPVKIVWTVEADLAEIELTGVEIGNGDDVFDVESRGKKEWRVNNKRKYHDTSYKYRLFGARNLGGKTLPCVSEDPWIYNK